MHRGVRGGNYLEALEAVGVPQIARRKSLYCSVPRHCATWSDSVIVITSRSSFATTISQHLQFSGVFVVIFCAHTIHCVELPANSCDGCRKSTKRTGQVNIPVQWSDAHGEGWASTQPLSLDILTEHAIPKHYVPSRSQHMLFRRGGKFFKRTGFLSVTTDMSFVNTVSFFCYSQYSSHITHAHVTRPVHGSARAH